MKTDNGVVAKYFDEHFTFESLEALFKYLVQKSKTQRIVIIIDEFTYLIKTNPEIMSILQNIIDHLLIDSRLKLIISGSHVGMIEDALAYQKPLYGRATFKMKIEAFDYYDAAKFYPKVSNEDKVRLYSIFGGVPFYNSKIDDNRSVEDNIKTLIIEKGAVFEDEVSFFLSQEVRSVATYGKIINAIASGATRLNDISTKSGSGNTGTTSKYLDLLIQLGIVEREYCFGEGANSRKTIYRIKDRLFNFHYSFIEKHKSQRIIMTPDRFYNTVVKNHLDEYVSLEFEQVCKDFLKRKYKETIEEIGRYWYNDRQEKKDIEIDIVMRANNLLSVYECKWTDSPVGTKVVNELAKKAKSLDYRSLGFFSKAGYDNQEYKADCYIVDDLFSIN
jgi:AAA+ ATPase superfamily predicted ATPase